MCKLFKSLLYQRTIGIANLIAMRLKISMAINCQKKQQKLVQSLTVKDSVDEELRRLKAERAKKL
jgi:hypothetical protein